MTAVALTLFWTGHSIAALACAVSCAPAERADAPVELAVAAPAIAHEHHHATADSHQSSSARTEAEAVVTTARHNCHESGESAVTLATPAGSRIDKLSRVDVNALSGVLKPSQSSADVSARWHYDLAAAAPDSTSRPFVLRI